MYFFLDIAQEYNMSDIITLKLYLKTNMNREDFEFISFLRTKIQGGLRGRCHIMIFWAKTCNQV